MQCFYFGLVTYQKIKLFNNCFECFDAMIEKVVTSFFSKFHKWVLGSGFWVLGSGIKELIDIVFDQK
jgi:hypothetical protein